MAPPTPVHNKHSPLPNPFFTGAAGSNGGRSPRSSLSGKDSLGRIPSMSSLKSSVEKINSPARRISSSLASVTSGPVASSSENVRPKGLQLGKHFHSYDDLANYDGSNATAAASTKRRSPRKMPKIKLQQSSEDLDALLAVQKALFRLRTNIGELVNIGDHGSAQYWILKIFNDASLSGHTHWSDHFRFFKIGMLESLPVKPLLEAFKDYLASLKGNLHSCMLLVHFELLARAEMWEDIAKLFDSIEMERLAEDTHRPAMKNWDREQFPEGWVPIISVDLLKARIYHFAGLAQRHLGNFEKAIDAFDLSTQFEPFMHASVAEMVQESKAIIPSCQRHHYLDTLALSSQLKYSLELENLFNAGNYARVYEETKAHFRNSKNLLSLDCNLLVMHLGCLASLKMVDELFAQTHYLVEMFPQKAISWYAVGLYYEVIENYDDSRRYLMKACGKDESFGPAWLLLGHSFSRSGDHDQAVSAYALLARHTAPASIHPRLFLAMEFLKTKQAPSANLYLVEAFNTDRNNPWIMNEIGALYCLQQKYVKAIGMLNSALRVCRKCPEKFQGDQLPIAILSNLLAVYLKFFPSSQNLMVEVQAAAPIVEDLLKMAPISKLPLKTVLLCAAMLEVRASLVPSGNSELFGRAAELFHQVIELSERQDKQALLGYNRCLVFKVQNSTFAEAEDMMTAEPPAFSESNASSGDDMAIDDETPSIPAHFRTPVKHAVGHEVESPAASERPTASRPPTLRRRLTSLSFSQAEDEGDSDY